MSQKELKEQVMKALEQPGVKARLVLGPHGPAIEVGDKEHGWLYTARWNGMVPAKDSDNYIDVRTVFAELKAEHPEKVE